VGDLAQGVAPVAGDAVLHDDLAREGVGHAVEELLLVGDVVVERHRPHPEFRGDVAHRDGVDAVAVGDSQGGRDDGVRAQPAPCLAAGVGRVA
jgi:hypothetical protein